MVGRFPRQIHGGATVEEVVRLQREPDIFNRHDWKILGFTYVGVSESVPKHDVAILDVPVLPRVNRNSAFTCVLMRIVATRKPFVGMILRHPKALGSESCTPSD